MALGACPRISGATGSRAHVAGLEIRESAGVTIPVLAKCRIGLGEARILEALKVDFIDESSRPADEVNHVYKHDFGCRLSAAAQSRRSAAAHRRGRR
jgi:pyridoxal biosynthesis lyase PdxS